MNDFDELVPRPVNPNIKVGQNPLPCMATVIQSVRYQQPLDQPFDFKIQPYVRKVFSEEQPYSRDLSIPEEWKLIDVGWIDKVGLLVIFNKEGKNLSVQPTPEEKIAIGNRVIELGYSFLSGEVPGVFMVIAPGETQVLTPYDITKLRIRCRKGQARCTIGIVPV